MNGIDLLGLAAGALTTLGIVPQIVRVFRLKSAREISLAFSLLMSVGIALWLLYGVLQRVLPLIYWNSISLGLLALLVYGKLKYGRSP